MNPSIEPNTILNKWDDGSALFQYKALLIRNSIIKKREKRKTLTEFVMPLYCILILACVRLLVKETTFEAITEPHDGALLQLNNIPLLRGSIFVTPDTMQVRKFIDDLANLTNFTTQNVEYFANETLLLEYYFNNSRNVTVALTLLDDPFLSPLYTIRTNPTKDFLVSPSTLFTDESKCRMQIPFGLENGFSCPTNSYFDTGFLSLQSAIDSVIIQGNTADAIPMISKFLQSFPKNEYTTGGTMILRSLVPLYLVFAWAQFIVYMMILIVEEKEKKIKEGMKMMGLRGSVYWLSWVTIYFIYVVLLSIICIIVLPLANVFQYANLTLLFILFVLYGLSSIILALMLTPFFNKAKVAGIVGQLVQIAMSLLFYLQVYLGDQISSATFWALALLSPCAFSLAIDKVILFDFSAGGLNWNNVWDGDGLPFAGSLIMISVDIILYLAVAIYLDNIIPSEYGTKRKPWFLFQRSTWHQRRNSKVEDRGSSFTMNDNLAEGNPDLEPPPLEFLGKEAVRMRHLSKTFKSRGKDPVKAVSGISLDIYEGQITAILGHNGAGKTTLFNMLTGMISSTSGWATVFNLNPSCPSELVEIRRLTGVCPQQDILFINLTVQEHLEFYARIKGIRSKDMEEKVNKLLNDLDLKSKANTKASDLSGGQKRKLSIGIALIGDPKIIFLDEPTAGVDAYSRRHVWSLLKQKKEGRVIILTTHFMDEADLLADRKAIISSGKLRCCGSSLFLKRKFGLGYHLRLVVSEGSTAEEVESVVQEVIPEAELARYYGNEVSFNLPLNSTNSFPQLFSVLDSTSEGTRLIGSYGISMTTLEEVFLKLSEEKEIEEEGNLNNLTKQVIRSRSMSLPLSGEAQTDDLSHKRADSHQQGFNFGEIEIEKSGWRAFMALLQVRFLNIYRELAAILFLIVVPLLMVVGSVALAKSVSVTVANDDKIMLTTDLYLSKSNQVLLYNATNYSLPYVDEVLWDSGLETSLYNGSYYYIYETQPHFSSFDIFVTMGSGNPELQQNVTIRYNTSLTHSLPITVNLVSNALFSSYFAPVMIGYVFALIPSGLVIDIVYDREIKARNLLRVNGVSFDVYFSSFFVAIGFPYFISYIGLLIIIQAFQVPSLVQPSAYCVVALLYLVYMPTALLFSSCASYVFDKQETARQFYPSIAITLGFICYTIISVVDLLKGPPLSTTLHFTFTLLVPSYIPFGAMYYVNRVFMMCSLLQNCDELQLRDYMTDEILFMFVVCFADTFIFYIMLRIVDNLKLGGNISNFLRIKRKASQLEGYAPEGISGDEDVEAERERVLQSLKREDCNSPASVFDLGKTYCGGGASGCCRRGSSSSGLAAIKSLSFEVRAGEVFGLLGPNGAGKTTTLQIMTAEEAPSKGQVRICGCDITSSLSSAFENLGYCPQHDCLWKNITVLEHIRCYANIRGVNRSAVKKLVRAYVDGLHISEHQHKKSKNCSGGTKRKLSYILSMMGCPKLVLLDEPSTGMDPQSKRFLWNSIVASFKSNRSSILTTHSMEEADALCSRIGIMVRGEFKCLGSVQHLKNKYGGGYSLEVKLKNEQSGVSDEDHENVKEIICRQFPAGVVDEEFEERILFKVPQSDLASLSSAFGMLEKLKSDDLVEEYSLSQTTLEQVFLQFARLQEEEFELGRTLDNASSNLV